MAFGHLEDDYILKITRARLRYVLGTHLRFWDLQEVLRKLSKIV